MNDDYVWKRSLWVKVWFFDSHASTGLRGVLLIYNREVSQQAEKLIYKIASFLSSTLFIKYSMTPFRLDSKRFSIEAISSPQFNNWSFIVNEDWRDVKIQHFLLKFLPRLRLLHVNERRLKLKINLRSASGLKKGKNWFFGYHKTAYCEPACQNINGKRNQAINIEISFIKIFGF